MIIDPIANDLGIKPPHSGERLSAVPRLDVDYASKLPEDPPPPYTEIDGFEPLTATLGPGPSVPRTLSSTAQYFRHSHLRRRAPSPAEQVQEGLSQITNSVMFVAEAALVTVGGFAQGIGKVLTGLGMAVAERRALSCKSF